VSYSAPPDTKNGVLQPGQRFGFTGNVWVASFGPYNRLRALSRLVIIPPSDATVTTELLIFNEQHKLANAPTGIATGFAPLRMLPLTAGTSTFVVWNLATGNAPEVTMFMEQEYF
jgi:hypothetical protein